MKISISIVSYNSRNVIDDALQSITSSVCKEAIDVYVVDNLSQDSTPEYVESKYPQVKVLRTNANLGYGGGHNKAIHLINSEVHFIINPDIKFDSDLIMKCATYMEMNPDVGIMIPAVKGYDGTVDVVPRRLPAIRRLLGSFCGAKTKLLKKWKDTYYMADMDISLPFDVEICSGCFMVIRTELLKKVNGFDERFFLYFEDFDLSRRIGKFGKIVCNPTLTVMHEGQHEGHKSLKAFKILFRSMCKYFNKWGWKI